MHVNQIFVVLFFSFFTTIASKTIQPSFVPDNINVNININGYVYGEVITKEGHYCSENDKNGLCPCKKNFAPVCAGGKTYDNHCMYSCTKKKALCNGSPSFPSETLGECIYDKCSAPKLISGAVNKLCAVTRWTYDQNEKECKKVWTSGGLKQCEGNGIQNKFLSYKECSAACKNETDVREWSEWSACSQTCGEGQQKRHCWIDWSHCPDLCKCMEWQKCNLGSCGESISNEFTGGMKFISSNEKGQGNMCTADSILSACRCPRIYGPVCAGGKTYSNLCMYKCAKKKAKCNDVRRFPKVTKNNAC